MIKIVVDAMGGDAGSKVIVDAINSFSEKHNDVNFVVVGKKEELSDVKGHEIVDARDVIPMEAGALEVMRSKESSMYKAVNICKNENGNAVISCGSTGGFLSTSTLLFKNIEGVKRSCLVAPFPTKIKNKKVVILDVGANNENSAVELVQFAKMGRLYSQKVYGVTSPKVYLLSNGSEEGKGAPIVKEAYKLLKDGNFEGFMGNIEARDALSGEADVIVCDGFTGNVFLKASEGVAKLMSTMIKAAFKKNLWSMLGYLHVKKGMKEMSETMDYKSTGGALLLGVNNVTVKAHGNSDAYAFECAINVAYSLARANIVEEIKKEIN